MATEPAETGLEDFETPVDDESGDELEDAYTQPEPVYTEDEEGNLVRNESEEPTEESEEEGSSEEEPSSAVTPSWVPEGVNWDALDAESRAALAYREGQIRSADQGQTQPIPVQEEPEYPQFRPDPVPVPDGYEDDPAIVRMVESMNGSLAHAAEWINTQTAGLISLQGKIRETTQSQEAQQINSAWNTFETTNNVSEEERLQMHELLTLTELPREQQWEKAYAILHGNGTSTPRGKGRATGKTSRALAAREAQAANPRGSANVLSTVEADDEINSFEDAFEATVRGSRRSGA